MQPLPLTFAWSGRLDLNQRPLEPHSSALPYCATSRRRSFYHSGTLLSITAVPGGKYFPQRLFQEFQGCSQFASGAPG